MPRDPEVPLVCLDEASKQLLQDSREPVPMKPGQPARHDYEYERRGTANLFMFFAPLEGWRHVRVTDRRTAADYAHALRELADKHFPDARQIRLVQDNLNTHKPASLYETFAAERRGGSSSASSGTIRPSTAAGSTWPSPRSPFSCVNVSIVASPTAKRSLRKPPHGRNGETNITPKPIGSSQLPTHASSSKPCIQLFR